MKPVVALLFLLLLPALWAFQQAPRTLAFTHVTVIDGTGAKPRLDQTVILTGDRITGLGRTGNLKLPTGAQIVEASGRFLIPGMWDMHVHLDAKSSLPLFVANGVTGVRTMDGDAKATAAGG